MRPLTIRARLAFLVVVTTLPLVLFTVLLVLRGSDTERALLQQQAGATVDAAMQRVDRELSGAIAGLQVLAASPALAQGNLAAFHAQARAAVGIGSSSVIILYGRDGSRLVSTAAPYGTPLPRRRDMSALEAPFQTARPHVSRLFQSETVQQPTLGLVVPVIVGGEVRYVLGAGLLSRRLTDLLKLSGLPAPWIGTLLDQDGTIIARTRHADQAVGRKAMRDNWARIRDSPTRSGTFSGVSQEGDRVLLAFSKSEASGWTTVVGIPVATLDEALQASLSLVGSVGAAVVAIALLLAWRAAGAIYRPTERLQEVAAALEAGRPAEVPARLSPPFDRLAVAMEQAARRILEREAAVTSSLARLEQAHRSLREEQVRKDRFIATLAHELRNPLAPIRHALHLLRKAPPPASAERALAIMERQVGHVVKLIDELLDVSRIARGKVSLNPEPLVLQTAVAHAIEAAEPAFAAAGLTLTAQMDDEPIWVHADSTRLNQVIGNLLDNAAKFTPDRGQVRVTVGRDAGQALLRVTDTGIGIAPGQLGDIFETFTQIRDDSAPRPGGLGIGLSIARTLVELHGGTIEASSAGPGAGARFTVRLPLSATAAPAPPAPAAELPAAAAPRAVLVVDDNVDAAQTLAEVLRASGHRVSVVHDGPAALQAATQEAFDLILLDIGLPGMDGYDVCRALRARPASAGRTIVALTGWGAPEDRRRAEAAGFDAHLTKPVEWPQLDAVLRGL